MMASKQLGLAVVALLAAQGVALAQDADMVKPANHKARPLTVRRRAAPPAPVAAAPGNPVAAPIGVASTIVGLPFQAIGTITGAGAGPRAGGPTNVRYANSGPEVANLDEGFAMGVPVDRSGPIFVVKNGDPTVNPLTFIGAPISAAGSLAQLPFAILGATAPKI